MWRRNNNPEPQMSYHAYPEPAMDERYLETIHEVESLYSRTSRRSSVHKTLPELPFRAVPPMYERDSVYSNDPVSPIAENFYQTSAAHQRDQAKPLAAAPEPVSPVSSKSTIAAPNDNSSGSLVSPVEPRFPPSNQAQQAEIAQRSQIPKRLPLPIATKAQEESTRLQKRWSHKASKDEETKWDAYSGEPTDGDRGQASAYRAGGAPKSHQYPQLKERTKQILAGLKDREAVKKSAWGKESPPVEDPMDNPVQRPAWKGASGRTTLVEPVKNTPAARTKPLILLQRKNPDVEDNHPVVEESSSARSHAGIPARSPSPTASPILTANPSEESIKPLAPLKGRNTPRVMSPTQAENMKSLESPFQSPGLFQPNRYDAIPSPAPSTVHDHGADSPTLGSVRSFKEQEPQLGASDEPLVTGKPKPLEREPDTTSSWNTYATSTVDESQHVPSSPISRTQLTSSPTPLGDSANYQPSPIILRKRVAANNSGRSYDNHNIVSPFAKISVRKSSSSILRKAIGSGEKHRSVSAMSGISVSKSLPPTPVEAEAPDKASSLEARLEDLTRRKRNNNKIIHELKDSLRRNAIIYDTYKRKEVEKMIINLNLELQEITNEEHEVGLRLHRVQRRRDKDDFYEKPTGLWIKRVTT